jgi:hypothetical protein
MNLDIFKKDDPSGRMSKESYILKNHKEEYDYIINYCELNKIFDIQDAIHVCLVGNSNIDIYTKLRCTQFTLWKEGKPEQKREKYL